jgi:hypothetical protein
MSKSVDNFLDWLNTPELRKGFAEWLRDNGINFITEKQDAQCRDEMESELKKIAGNSRLSPAKQVRKLQKMARTRGCEFDTRKMLEHFHFDLVTTPRQKRGADASAIWRRKAFLASPWRAERVQQTAFRNKAGGLWVKKHYPNVEDKSKGAEWNAAARQDAKCRAALSIVFKRFASPQTWLMPTTKKDIRTNSRLSAVIRKYQSRDLANLVVRELLEPWPCVSVPAGMRFDPADYFASGEFNRKLAQSCKHNRDLLEFAAMAIADDDFRAAMAQLVDDARKRKKGWAHLSAAIADALDRVTRAPSMEELARNFETDFSYPLEKEMTHKERQKLLREPMGHDPNKSRRKLKFKERMVLAEKRAGISGIARASYARAKRAAKRTIKSS